MANVSGAVQIETGIKHGLSIPFQSVAGEQSIDVGTLLGQNINVPACHAEILQDRMAGTSPAMAS
jgi:hypothetical protein